MKTSDIPAPVLSEVFKTIAQLHNTSEAKMPKDSIPEEEFMAALAHNLCAPLLEDADLTTETVELCRQCSRELDPVGMAEYRFVPMVIKGQTLLSISSCPWDPMMVEVCLGYFPQCTAVRFVLASPQTLTNLLSRLKNEPITNIGGYSTAKPVAAPKPISPPITAPVIAPPKPFEPSVSPVKPPVSTPALTPSVPVPRPVIAPQSIIAEPPTATAPAAEMLTAEDISYLLTVLVTEGNKLLARRRKNK